MKYISFLTTVLLLLVTSNSVSARTKHKQQYEIEIAEIGQPGLLVIRTWCYSKKPNIPDTTFKECAIKGVLFVGLNDSGRMKGRKALVEDGYEKHKEYFDSFFKDGDFLKYTKMAMNGYVEQNSIVKVGKLYKVAKIVVISFQDLRLKLENDKIIKGLNSGF